MYTVTVQASRDYEIKIGAGLLAQAGAEIRHALNPGRVAVVTDDNVAALYADALEASLHAADIACSRYVFAHGENAKQWQTLSDMLEHFADTGLTRADAVICLGGGVVGDAGGLAAGLYLRGIPFVQIPTTLLAAVDSSVGGKTAVNLSAGKNLCGMFVQPSLVLCDTDILRDLPYEIMRDGAAEVLKYGVLDAPELLETIIGGQLTEQIDQVVWRCVSIKRDYVCEDEFDRGRRQLLNLGHTIGHAVESCSAYTVGHGTAVGIGMAVIARAAQETGFSQDDCLTPVLRALEALGLPAACDYTAGQLLASMGKDKKREGESITLIVPVRVGCCERVKVPVTRLSDWLAAGGVRA